MQVAFDLLYECRLRSTCSYSLLLFSATCFGSTEPSSSNVYTILQKLLYSQRIRCCYLDRLLSLLCVIDLML
jgi:hypothetical protein